MPYTTEEVLVDGQLIKLYKPNTFNYTTKETLTDGKTLLKFYNKNTKQIWKTSLLKKEKLDGETTEYFINGNLKNKILYKQGKKIATNKVVNCPYRCGKTTYKINHNFFEEKECLVCKEDCKYEDFAYFLNCNHTLVCLTCAEKL
jgi:antitoxin component YwqK of YwqJK toxin-antitoxin module